MGEEERLGGRGGGGDRFETLLGRGGAVRSLLDERLLIGGGSGLDCEGEPWCLLPLVEEVEEEEVAMEGAW